VIFTGHSEHAIDSKSRVAVPAKFRNLLDKGRDGEAWYCVAWPDGSLRLYTEKRFVQLAEQSEQNLTPNEAEAQFESVFFGMAERLEMDEKGRIPLPRLLMESVGLTAGTEVVISGARNRLEIRRREEWQAGLKEKFEQLPALVARMEARRAAGGNGLQGSR
jgi:MraZ protein